MVLAIILLKGETNYRNVLSLSRSQLLEDYPNTKQVVFMCENIEFSKSFEFTPQMKEELEVLRSFFKGCKKSINQYGGHDLLLREWIQLYEITKKLLTNIKNCKNLKEPQK